MAGIGTDDEALIRDWMRLWEGELRAWSADPEALAAWRSMAALWSKSLEASARGWTQGAGTADPDDAAHPDGKLHPAPGTASAGASPVAGDDARERIDRLERRVAALEARLGPAPQRPAGGGKRKPRQRET